MKGVKVVHILGKCCWYEICSSNVFVLAKISFYAAFKWIFAQNFPKAAYFFDQWWQARWCIRYAAVFWSIERWSKFGQEIDFLTYLESFFVYALMHSMRYTPRFCQMKYHIMIYICGKFQQYGICGCETKNFRRFLYWFNIHEMALFWGLTPPNIVWSCWNFDHKWSAIRKTQCLKNISKFWILAQMECS